jgi:glycosyltransferase involved in cell wall biosynthesis
MSYGLPVLASDIPANKEVNLPASCYFHYDENIVNNLSQALLHRLEDESVPHYDMTAYNWDRIAEQTIDVYLKIMK